MMKKYPYRFKTEKEFVKEFGINWKSRIRFRWNPDGYMDYLLGKEYPYIIVKTNRTLDDVDDWNISWDMLTENKPTEPIYKPKEKVIRTL